MQEIAKVCQWFVENPPKSFAAGFPQYSLGDVYNIQQFVKHVENSPKNL